MYSPFQLFKKYIAYRCKAANGKGHGIHSPFVFEFVNKVLRGREKDERFAIIEERRSMLRNNNEEILVEDFGAGSRINKTQKRKISAIASSSLKPRKYARLLYRMIRYYQPPQVLELGTSLGITTSYLALNNKPVVTLEGSSEIAAIAEKFFSQHFHNIQLVKGNFDDTLDKVLQQHPKVSFAFVDGNHRKEPTLAYFRKLLAASDEYTIMVFDDVHWSAEMEEAWEIIKEDPAVTLSIDLFFIGIVFFRKDFLVKQHYTIRY